MRVEYLTRKMKKLLLNIPFVEDNNRCDVFNRTETEFFIAYIILGTVIKIERLWKGI